MIGDVVGKGGRKTLSTLLPDLIEEQKINFVIAQGENSAGGFGITKKTSREFFDCGVDFITSGNHIWDKPDIFEELDVIDSKILRPSKLSVYYYYWFIWSIFTPNMISLPNHPGKDKKEGGN